MNDVYFRYVIAEPQVLLQRQLKPFCAGHLALLHRTQSVFVTGGRVDHAQLASAVLICAQNFRDGCASLNDPATPTYMKQWGKELGRRFDLLKAKETFEAWLARGSEFPLHYIPRETSAGKLSISDLPHLQRVRCALKHFYHVREEEFWDMPWGLALWDYFTIPVINDLGDLVRADKMEDAAARAAEIALNWDRLDAGQTQNPPSAIGNPKSEDA